MEEGQCLLPPGVRFVPTDAELLEDYLRPRLISGTSDQKGFFLIHETDVYARDPEQLYEAFGGFFPHRSGKTEMFFFTTRRRKGAKGSRVSRAVAGGAGAWHGGARSIPVVNDHGVVVGSKEQFSFLRFQDGEGGVKKAKTKWLMQEYCVKPRHEFDIVLVKIYYKEGGGERWVEEEILKEERPVKRQRGVTVEEEEEEALIALMQQDDESFSSFLEEFLDYDDNQGGPEIFGV